MPILLVLLSDIKKKKKKVLSHPSKDFNLKINWMLFSDRRYFSKIGEHISFQLGYWLLISLTFQNEKHW